MREFIGESLCKMGLHSWGIWLRHGQVQICTRCRRKHVWNGTRWMFSGRWGA